jgi:hypothetical protein
MPTGSLKASSFFVVGQECGEVRNVLCSRTGTFLLSRRLEIINIPVR